MKIETCSSSKKINLLFKGINFDPDLKLYKNELIDRDELEIINTSIDEFYYILDLSTHKIISLSDNFEKKLGYDPKKITYKFLMKIIHKNDRDIVIDATQHVLSIIKETKVNNLDCYIFCIDFRIKKSDGTFMRVQKKSSLYKQDNKGNILLALSKFTDISAMDKCEKVNAYFFNSKTNKAIIIKTNNHKGINNGIFTTQQLIILVMLSEGKTSAQIAKKMNLSYFTVVTHRKNMLAIAGTKNANELLIFAKERGYI
jgi:DNA-binding CsgD family transcriptional regulator